MLGFLHLLIIISITDSWGVIGYKLIYLTFNISLYVPVHDLYIREKNKNCPILCYNFYYNQKNELWQFKMKLYLAFNGVFSVPVLWFLSISYKNEYIYNYYVIIFIGSIPIFPLCLRSIVHS